MINLIFVHSRLIYINYTRLKLALKAQVEIDMYSNKWQNALFSPKIIHNRLETDS